MLKILNIMLILLLISTPILADNKPKTFGWLESVKLLPYQTTLIAKFDTGAKTSSLHATNMKYFNKNGQKWVKFIVPIENKNIILSFEKPVMGYSRIKLREDIKDHTDKEYLRRPKVKMLICLDSRKIKIIVNLTDRANFNYPLLIGRDSIITIHAIINPKQEFTTRPRCQTQINK